jgi:hypothetical protein
MSSYFDKSFYPFFCENPKCRRGFRKVLHTLLDSVEFICPRCGTAINIHEAKVMGDVSQAFAKATELDKAAIQKY